MLSNNLLRRTTLLIAIICGGVNVFAQHWAPLGVGVNNAIRSLYSDSTSNLLYVGGLFTKAGGNKSLAVAVWNGTTWDSLGGGANTGSPILTFSKFNNQIYSVGEFEMNSENYLARWNGVNWDTITKVKNVVGIKTIGNFLYVYGGFDSIAGIPASYIAKWDGTNWAAVDTTHWQLSCIADIITFQGNLYATGNFANYNESIHQIAKWDGVKWQSVGGGFLGGTDWGNCFEIYNNELYVGGVFSKADGNPGNGIARWDGSAWYDVGGGISCCGGAQIVNMLVFNSSLYAVGTFTNMSGVPARFFSKWDGTKWCGFGSVFTTSTSCLANYNGQLIIGGAFKSIDGDTLDSRIAKWIGGAYTDTCGFSVSVQEHPGFSSFESTLFPNPNNGSFQLMLKNLSGVQVEISVVDLVGRELYRSNETSNNSESLTRDIDLTAFPKGMYLLRVQNGLNVATDKVIIQ